MQGVDDAVGSVEVLVVARKIDAPCTVGVADINGFLKNVTGGFVGLKIVPNPTVLPALSSALKTAIVSIKQKSTAMLKTLHCGKLYFFIVFYFCFFANIS